MYPAPVSFRLAPCVVVMALASLSSSLHAAVLTGPSLHRTMDPPGSRAVTMVASGSATQAQLERLPGFAVVRDFTGFEAGENVIAFEDARRSDIRLRFWGRGDGGSGAELRNASFVTSGNSGVRIASNNPTTAHTLNGLIEFGYWDGQGFTAGVNPVQAAGFTLAAPDGRFARVGRILVEFLAGDDRVLSRQEVVAIPPGEQGVLFGHVASGHDVIGSIRITIEISAMASPDAAQAVLLGLDDLGSTPTATTAPEGVSRTLFP